MADSLVLITGATGHLGFRILREALEAGYHVRAAVRSEQKATALKDNPVLQATAGVNNLSFIIVPDFLIPGAFDEAVKGTKHIIHVASPISSKVPQDAGSFDRTLIQPAVQGTLGVFESAKNVGSVRRIVVTSSTAAIAPMSAYTAGDDQALSADNRGPEMEGPFDNSMMAYVASKIAALNRAEAWIKAEQPSFDVIHIHPSFIFGRDDTATSTEAFQTGTNSIPLNIALGKTSNTWPNNWNDVADTAKIHVLSLDPKIPGNQSFFASTNGLDGTSFDAVKDIVSRNFPEAVESGILPNNGSCPSFVSKLDTSKSEETFGLKLATYEQTVVGVVGHYLEVLKNEKEGGKK